jgi:ferredoxin
MGHGRCNAISPELFPLDELGFSALGGKGEIEVPEGSDEAGRAGARECPERAIQVLD